MSRVIDQDRPLSDEDRKFLMENGQENKAAAHDARLGIDTPPPAHVTGNEPSLSTGFTGGVANAPGLSPTQAAMALGDKAVLFGLMSDEDLENELQRRQDEREAAEDEDGEDSSLAAREVVRESDDGVPSYDSWKADNLRSQLGVRELSKAGNKSELAARLREDDEDDEVQEV
jgi:hypothetical protein